MIEERARVVELIPDGVVIEAARTSACAQCQSASNCGQKSLSEWAASKMTHIEVDNPSRIVVCVGDDVIVGIDEGGFIKASALIYMLPLMIMVVFGVAAQLNALSEPLVILSSFLGLGIGFLIVRYFGKTMEKRNTYRPVLLRIS
jgi:sigma-E factor negative regulatory protein RseC